VRCGEGTALRSASARRSTSTAAMIDPPFETGQRSALRADVAVPDVGGPGAKLRSVGMIGGDVGREDAIAGTPGSQGAGGPC
jgi:hypothetical protein